jgi:hypothetical protein
MDAGTPDPSPEAVDAFVSRWEGAKRTERANYQRFLMELCALPNHPGDLPEGTLRAILRQAAIEPEEFLRAR